MTSDIKNFQFNTAISQLMELINLIQKVGTTKETAITMVKLIAPFAPFIAEDCWKLLNQENSVHSADWPEVKEELTVDNDITIGVQVNGKVREKLNTSRSSDEDQLKLIAFNQDNVKKHIENKEIIKTIVVKERLINFVVK